MPGGHAVIAEFVRELLHTKMLSRNVPVTPGEAHGWQAARVDREVILPDASRAPYSATVAMREQGKDGRLTCTVKTSPLFKSELSFDVLIEGKAFIAVTCNSKKVFSGEVAADELTLKEFKFDITPCTESEK